MAFMISPKIIPAGWHEISMGNDKAIKKIYPNGFTIVYSEEHFDGNEIDLPPMGSGTYRHISISRPNRYPEWDEMRDYIYSCAWFEKTKDTIMILPPKNQYMNLHHNCFHFYQKKGE